ncbi:MAG: type II secretion system protein GspD [Armatimonadota bacterium]
MDSRHLPGRRGAWTALLAALLACLLTACLQSQEAEEPAADEDNERLRVSVTEAGVSLYAVSVDAHQLFATLGAETGIRIIVDDTVNRRITVNLTDKQVTEILDDIVAAYGFSCSQVEGVWLVSEGIPNNPSSYLLSDIDAITTKYVLAPNAKSLLPVFLQDHVKTNPGQNAVVLSAPSQVLEKFRADIQQFDIPAAQIMIEVLVVEFTDVDKDDFDLAIDWANAGRAAFSVASGGMLGFSVVTGLPDDFRIRLKALVEKRKARVRANPRIATVSGQRAEIFIGQQQFLSTPITMPDEETASSIDAGVRLQMTPWTGGQGEILAEISPEVSTLSAPDPTTGLPDKSTRTASTMVRVRDGETIIIGGLLQDELRQTRTKVPILGDIPLIGGLFRSKSRTKTKTELVIFITPKILSQTGHLPPDEETAIKQKFLGEHADTDVPAAE